MLKYKGYLGKVDFDPETKTLYGRVIGIRDVITFQSKSAEEIEREFRDSIDVYLEFCTENGVEPNKIYSGKFMVRVPPELHAKLELCSKLNNKSLNSWIREELEEKADETLAKRNCVAT